MFTPHRPDTLLQVKGTRRFLRLSPVTAEQAEAVGCPGATVVLEGSAGAGGWSMFGTARALGTSRSVPGWTRGTLGYRVEFTPSVVDPDTGSDVVVGYVNATLGQVTS